MRFHLVLFLACMFLVTVFALVPQKPVVITFRQDTPSSIIEQAKKAIEEAGGIITHEYQLIKGFAAKASERALQTISALGEEYAPFIEEDQIVTVGGGSRH